MKRFDYAVTRAERLLGAPFPPAITPRLHAPLAALGASVVLAGATGGIQEMRLHAADRDAAEARIRLAAAELTVARVHVVRDDVVRLRALAARIAGIRRSGTVRASEIAALGNALPSAAWLTAVHIDRGTVGIEGRAAGVATVAATIAALAQLPAYGGARLLNVRDDAARPGVTYAIALETAEAAR